MKLGGNNLAMALKTSCLIQQCVFRGGRKQRLGDLVNEHLITQ